MASLFKAIMAGGSSFFIGGTELSDVKSGSVYADDQPLIYTYEFDIPDESKELIETDQNGVITNYKPILGMYSARFLNWCGGTPGHFTWGIYTGDAFDEDSNETKATFENGVVKIHIYINGYSVKQEKYIYARMALIPIDLYTAITGGAKDAYAS